MIWPTFWGFTGPYSARGENMSAQRLRRAAAAAAAAVLAVDLDPACDEVQKLLDLGLAELVNGSVVLVDRTMGEIVARAPDQLRYVRAIIRFCESTRETVDELAAELVNALRES